MKFQGSVTRTSIFVCIFLLLTTLISADEVESEAEFVYNEKSKKGPNSWGELNKDWAACKTAGKNKTQSPIDIDNKNVEIITKAGDVTQSYKPADAELKNRGHDIALYWTGDAGSLKIDGNDYALQQCHWHSPSEHTINGRRYDMEIHLVHKDRSGKAAVVGQLYEIGKPDEFLSKFSIDMMLMADTNETKKVGQVDPTEIRMAGRNYYRYIGSLTVPPCTEGVIWILGQRPAPVSQDQVKKLRHAVHDFANENARPVQPHNSRKIQLYSLPPV